MGVTRFAFVASVCALAFVGCGPALPPVGNYATVSGRVTDATSGAGVAGATVTVNVVLSATTDASGSFKISNVPTGSWDYTVVAPQGYNSPAPVDNPPPLSPSEARTLSIVLTHR